MKTLVFTKGMAPLNGRLEHLSFNSVSMWFKIYTKCKLVPLKPTMKIFTVLGLKGQGKFGMPCIIPTQFSIQVAKYCRYLLFNYLQNKLIFLYLKTRCCKYYTSNTTHIKLHKLSCIKNLTKSAKNWYPRN